eukprot:3270943-Prymnesium_polylepis.1
MEELAAAAIVLAMDVESNAGQENRQEVTCDGSGFADMQEAAPEPFAAGKENITDLPEQKGRRAAIDKVYQSLLERCPAARARTLALSGRAGCTAAAGGGHVPRGPRQAQSRRQWWHRRAVHQRARRELEGRRRCALKAARVHPAEGGRDQGATRLPARPRGGGRLGSDPRAGQAATLAARGARDRQAHRQ